jgi:hypothetical protein
MALHRLETIEEIFVGTPPRVVDAHGTIRRDWPIDETPRRLATVLLDKPIKRVMFAPKGQDVTLKCREVNVGAYW